MLSLLAVSCSALFGQSDFSLRRGYKGHVEAGYTVGTGQVQYGRSSVMTTHGYQFNPYFFAGAGLGWQYFNEISDHVVSPLLHMRASYPVGRVAPFFDFKGGVGTGDASGAFISPAVGCRIGLSERVGLSLTIGYELQKKVSDPNLYVVSAILPVVEHKFDAHGIAFRLGIDF